MFDALVRFGSGQFARLTPGGVQYWYDADGRLAKIFDRYPNNRHELSYNHRGELRRIAEASTEAGRYLEIGYYRFESDPAFEVGLDVETTNGRHAGKIARLMDHTGRDVLYRYDDGGKLSTVAGVEINTVRASDAAPAFTGRRTITYGWQACDLQAVSEGDQFGSPSFRAATQTDGRISTGNGIDGTVIFTVSHNNTAAGVAGGTTSVVAASGTSVARTSVYRFAPYAVVDRITNSGAGGLPETTAFEPDPAVPVRIHRITRPLGNSVTYTFESQSPNLRAQGNIESVVRTPGSAGGASAIPESFGYDADHYNVVTHSTDGAGVETEYVLRPDFRDWA